MALAITLIAMFVMAVFLFACLRVSGAADDASDDFADRLINGDEGVFTHFHTRNNNEPEQ